MATRFSPWGRFLAAHRKGAQLPRLGLNNFYFNIATGLADFRTSIGTKSYSIHFAARRRISEDIDTPPIFVCVGAFNLFGPKFGD
jgi:hypothetical protein